MPDMLRMFLGTVPSLAIFIGYLYAADSLDRLVHKRYPVVWNQILEDWDAHSSSNAFLLFRERELLYPLNDIQIAKLLRRLRYLFWGFGFALIFAFLFA